MSFQGKFLTRMLASITRDGTVITTLVSAVTARIKVLSYDSDGHALLATGTGVPDDAQSGFAKGCLFIDTDVGAGSTGLYENVGTTAACNFDQIGAKSTMDGLTATASEINLTCDTNTATAAEITRTCDVSTRKVSLSATAPITEALHEGKVCVITGTAAATYTLPEATGSGATYRFVIGQVNTSNNIIKTADATNASFYGSVNILDLDSNAQTAYAPAATDELLTLNGTTTGGQIGDYIEVIDMATDKWCIFGQLQCPAGSNVADLFSGA